MSKRTAATLADLSEGRWRQLENGGREIRGIWIVEEAPEPALARMALAVRLAPADIEPYSRRAAQMLGDLMAEREAGDRRDADDDAARMVDALGDRGLTGRQRAALETHIADTLRKLRE